MKEEWKDIMGYENLYQISNFGRIKSLERIKQIGKYFFHFNEIIMKLQTDSHGYKTVWLHKNGKGKNWKVHILVAKHYIPNPENKPYVNHIESNVTDNRSWMLSWVTPKENSEDAVARNRMTKGEKCHSSKLTEEQILEISKKYIPRKYSLQKLANEYGCTKQNIRKIITDKSWKHIKRAPQ
jgi:hypothetical protein